MTEQRMNRTSHMKILRSILAKMTATRAVALATALILVATGSALARTTPADSGGYTATDTLVYSFIDISGPGGGTSILAGTDDATLPINLPFTFKLYGTNYTMVCASSNGALYFVASAGACTAIGTADDFASTDLTVAGPPTDPTAALPFWTDLTFNAPGAGSIYYQSLGTTPGRRFVVQWSGAYANGAPVTFEVVLGETANTLTFQYQTVTLGGGNPASNGAQSTVGIRNSGGVSNGQQIEWSYDASVLQNSYAIQFQPGSAPPAPVLVSPANAATGVSTSTTLNWNTSTGATNYDVYFGTTFPPNKVATLGPAVTTYTPTDANPACVPSNLCTATTYNWQVVARNGNGSSGSSASFTTATQNCTYSLNPTSANLPASGGAGSFNVTAQAGCQWTVSGTPAWVTITSGAVGSGNGTVAYTAAASSGSASLVVGGKVYTITEPDNSSSGTGPPLSVIVAWASPSPITYGTPLSSTQLNAVSNAPGAVLVYSPARGTILPAGTQTLTVTGTATTYLPGSATVSLVVNKAPQTITFSPISSHLSTDAPFSLAASATSGLPISFSVVSGPATIGGNALTITGTGNVTVQAGQAGNSNYLAATPVVQSFSVSPGTSTISSVLNAGSYATAPLAMDGYTVLFGANFAAAATSATSLPLPNTLGGVTVTITDSNGLTLPALLNYVGPTQINFVVPEGLATGPVTVTVTTASGQTSTAKSTIASVSPSIFTADSSGKGAPAAIAVAYAADGTSQVQQAFSCSGSPLVCTAAPISLGPATSTVYLELFGTGIRGNSGISTISVTIGNTTMNVAYAGAQATYAGLDQVNVLLDRSLVGSGSQTLQLTVGGVAANPVTVNIQ
jgi:uncharacterized protein (TIGR03437 family)